MHMQIEWNLIMLVVLALLLLAQVVSQIILGRRLKKAFDKVEKYVNYIIEDGDGTSVPINIEETDSKGMDERQKELLLQEMLDGFLA